MSESPFVPSGDGTPEPVRLPRLLCWLAVSDRPLLQASAADSARIQLIGLSVLVTWIFASLAWGYYFYLMFDSVWKALPLALFFGFAIMNIDRNLIAAVRRRKGLPGAFPLLLRLLLAGLIGLFLSQPLLLALFREDIQSELLVRHQQELGSFQHREDSLFSARLQPYTEQQAALRDRLQQGQSSVGALRQAYLDEADGSGGSHRVGLGRLTALKEAAFREADSAQRRLQLRAAPRLAYLSRISDSLRGQEARELDAYHRKQSSGFLAQAEALSALAAAHAAVRQRIWLLVAIMSLLEIMPVLAKYLLPASGQEQSEELARSLAALQRERILARHPEELDERDRLARDWNRRMMEAFYRSQEQSAEKTLSELDREQESLQTRWQRFIGQLWQKDL